MSVEREERAAKAGNPSRQRLRQDDSCFPIYPRLKSEVNQRRLLPPVPGHGVSVENIPSRPSISPGSASNSKRVLRN